jgi:DTW domain-containing protein YfiP
MPKGEKLMPKQLDQLPLVNFKSHCVSTYILIKAHLLQNYSLVGEKSLLWGKGGVFGF